MAAAIRRKSPRHSPQSLHPTCHSVPPGALTYVCRSMCHNLLHHFLHSGYVFRDPQPSSVTAVNTPSSTINQAAAAAQLKPLLSKYEDSVVCMLLSSPIRACCRFALTECYSFARRNRCRVCCWCTHLCSSQKSSWFLECARPWCVSWLRVACEASAQTTVANWSIQIPRLVHACRRKETFTTSSSA